MARTTDLFIDHASEEGLLAALRAATRIPPAQHGEGRWTVQITEELSAELRRHDPRRPVAGFGWDLRGHSACEGPSHGDPVTIAMRSLADDLRTTGCRVLVVHDLQHRSGGQQAPAQPGGVAGHSAPTPDEATGGEVAPDPDGWDPAGGWATGLDPDGIDGVAGVDGVDDGADDVDGGVGEVGAVGAGAALVDGSGLGGWSAGGSFGGSDPGLDEPGEAAEPAVRPSRAG